MPGRLNTLSVTTTPEISSAKPLPITVTTGTAALRSAWRSSTPLSLMPLARAVRTVFTQHIQHRRPGHAGDQRDIDERQRASRQDDALEKRPESLGDAAKALHRQPVQVDGENLDQQIADHEYRNREAEHRQSHHEAVDPGAVFPRRDHAKRHRDNDRENDGRHRDADRRFDALADHLQHRHVEISDTPRSPCSSLPTQVKNWM